MAGWADRRAEADEEGAPPPPGRMARTAASGRWEDGVPPAATMAAREASESAPARRATMNCVGDNGGETAKRVLRRRAACASSGAEFFGRVRFCPLPSLSTFLSPYQLSARQGSPPGVVRSGGRGWGQAGQGRGGGQEGAAGGAVGWMEGQ